MRVIAVAEDYDTGRQAKCARRTASVGSRGRFLACPRALDSSSRVLPAHDGQAHGAASRRELPAPHLAGCAPGDRPGRGALTHGAGVDGRPASRGGTRRQRLPHADGVEPQRLARPPEAERRRLASLAIERRASAHTTARPAPSGSIAAGGEPVSGALASRRGPGRRPPYRVSIILRWAGRAAVVAALATRIDELPLDAAAEVLILIEPTLATFERHAALALERAPAREADHVRRRDHVEVERHERGAGRRWLCWYRRPLSRRHSRAAWPTSP